MPPKKKSEPGKLPKIKASDHRRVWLVVPANIVKRPIVWELGHRFALITNIGQASITHEVGLISLELTGESEEIKKAISWLVGVGVKVNPVEIGAIEG